jgi:hypothetical protein
MHSLIFRSDIGLVHNLYGNASESPLQLHRIAHTNNPQNWNGIDKK